MKRETLNAILIVEVMLIFGLLMLLVAGSRLTDFNYLAERYQSLISRTKCSQTHSAAFRPVVSRFDRS
jgi:hypothetical protein